MSRRRLANSPTRPSFTHTHLALSTLAVLQVVDAVACLAERPIGLCLAPKHKAVGSNISLKNYVLVHHENGDLVDDELAENALAAEIFKVCARALTARVSCVSEV